MHRGYRSLLLRPSWKESSIVAAHCVLQEYVRGNEVQTILCHGGNFVQPLFKYSIIGCIALYHSRTSSWYLHYKYGELHKFPLNGLNILPALVATHTHIWKLRKWQLRMICIYQEYASAVSNRIFLFCDRRHISISPMNGVNSFIEAEWRIYASVI